jgi:hypothetical protein
MCFHKNIEYLTGTIGTVIEKVALFCIRTIRWSREKISPKNRQNWPVGGKAWPWTPQEDALLGTASDTEIAAPLGRKIAIVCKRRQKPGIPN